MGDHTGVKPNAAEKALSGPVGHLSHRERVTHAPPPGELSAKLTERAESHRSKKSVSF